MWFGVIWGGLGWFGVFQRTVGKIALMANVDMLKLNADFK